MKVRVLVEFVDRHSRELHEVGSSFECSEERYKEILSAGKYVAVVEETLAEETPKKAAKTTRKKTAKGE